MRPWAVPITVLSLLACAALCPLASAADEPPPPTGTIEVEVVYKDTGEPVKGVAVAVTPAGSADGGGFRSLSTDEDGKLTESAPWGMYVVRILNIRRYLGESAFLYGESEVEKRVTVSEAAPTVSARFEVVRGRAIRGTLTCEGGPPPSQYLVMVKQGATFEENARATVSEDGTFTLLGVAPSETARLEVVYPLHFRVVRPFSMMIPLGLGSDSTVATLTVPLSPEQTSVEVELESVSVDFVVDVVKPLWPFTLGHRPEGMIALWIGDHRAEDPRQADTREYLSGLEIATDPGLGKTQYRTRVDGVPANGPITIGSGFGRPEIPHTRSRSLASCSWMTSQLEDKDVSVHVMAYEPYARLSRAVWFGIVPAIVLVIGITAIVLHARRRRRPAETA